MNILKLRDNMRSACVPDHLTLQTIFEVCCGSVWSTPTIFETNAVFITIQFEIHADSKYNEQEFNCRLAPFPKRIMVNIFPKLPEINKADKPYRAILRWTAVIIAVDIVVHTNLEDITTVEW